MLLSDIISNDNFLKDLKHTKNYCHTGCLESYHNVRLKYTPKKSHFSYDGMVLRSMLAILDHNVNTGRGIVRSGIRYSKATKKYVEQSIRSPKCYKWRQEIVDKVCSFVGGSVDLAIEEDPYAVNVPQNIAPNSRPSPEEFQHTRYSRFQQL